MNDHANLRKLAGNATPGPWRTTSDDDAAILIAEIEDDSRDDYHGIYATGHVAPGKEDAEFIAAANPSTVIALLDEIERLRSEA